MQMLEFNLFYFKSEIASLKEEDNKQADNSSDEEEVSLKMKELESSLKLLEGQNVRVSYKEKWGGYSYHNAIVMSIVPHEGNIVNYDDPQVSLYNEILGKLLYPKTISL